MAFRSIDTAALVSSSFQYTAVPAARYLYSCSFHNHINRAVYTYGRKVWTDSQFTLIACYTQTSSLFIFWQTSHLIYRTDQLNF